MSLVNPILIALGGEITHRGSMESDPLLSHLSNQIQVDHPSSHKPEGYVGVTFLYTLDKTEIKLHVGGKGFKKK